MRAVGIYPIGALVRLRSERIGLVVEQNEKFLLKPKVMLLMSARSRLPLARTVIDLNRYSETDRIVRAESCNDWDLGNLDELWSGQPLAQGARF